KRNYQWDVTAMTVRLLTLWRKASLPSVQKGEGDTVNIITMLCLAEDYVFYLTCSPSQ
ncbi:unnamed protein product, partial [Ceratitis capitata]